MKSRHATVVAYLALFVALSGSAVAVTKIRSKDIVNNTVSSADIRNNTVASKDIRNKTIAIGDLRKSAIDALKGATGPAGAAGPPGAAGAAGAQGPAGPASVPARTTLVGAGGTPIENGDALRAAVAALPDATAEEPRAIQLGAGQYDVNGKGIVLPNDVTLQGAGRTATVILSSPANVKNNVLTIDDRAVVRDVAVRSASSALGSTAIDGTSGLDNVIERVSVSAGNGIVIKGGRIDDTDLFVLGTDGVGIRLLNGSSTPTLSGVTVNGFVDSGHGLFAATNFRMRDSHIDLGGSNGGVVGVLLTGVTGDSTIDNSRIKVAGGGQVDAVFVNTTSTAADLDIAASHVEAGGGTTSTALRANFGGINAAVTEVRGQDNASIETNGGNVACFQTYSSTFQAQTCP